VTIDSVTSHHPEYGITACRVTVTRPRLWTDVVAARNRYAYHRIMERLFSPAAAPLSLLVSFPAEDRRLSRTRYQHLLQVLSTVFHHILGPYISFVVVCSSFGTCKIKPVVDWQDLDAFMCSVFLYF